MSYVLTLPYPLSANRYWTSFKLGNRMMTAPSSEAKKYKRDVAILIRRAGITKPIQGRVRVGIELYPQRPQDWQKRAKRDPLTWDDDVRCIDLDNARKVLYDALKGLAFDDDKWVFEDHAKRMEPDGEARVVVMIEPIVMQSPQPALLPDAPIFAEPEPEFDDPFKVAA